MADSSPCIIPAGFLFYSANPACHKQERGGKYNPDDAKTLDSWTVRGSVRRPWQLTIRGLTSIIRREKLLGFDVHVGEFSEVLIEGGDWRVLERCGRRDQAVHEMNLCFSIAI